MHLEFHNEQVFADLQKLKLPLSLSMYLSLQIFVVDSSSNDDDVDLAASELQEAISHPSLGTLPLLVLANKQDVKGARSADEASFGDTLILLWSASLFF